MGSKQSPARIILYTAMSGLIAFAMITIGALLSAWFYSGRTGEPYSFLNHFISELGNRTYSGHAYFFNDAMLLAGLPIMIFMTGIWSLLRSRIRYAFVIPGLLSGLLCILLGYYSSDRFDIHIKVALCQFNAMLISSLLFSAAVVRERDTGHFSRWLGYAGAIPVLCIIAFLGVEFTHQQDMTNGHNHLLLYHRPDFWPLPFLEWLVFFSLITWIALICGYLIVNNVKSIRKTEMQEIRE
ncbi:MAG: rane protein of unknown function [Bacteroidetes bacterium]|nr:rane protein of unknown function [Bacteroidota bacterium]